MPAVLCTVAIGQRYIDLAAPLFSTLARAGNTCVVLTTDAAAFPDCKVLPYVEDGTHFTHRKRIALRAGLEIAQTAYWAEADAVLSVPFEQIPVFPELPPGLWSRFALPAMRGTSSPANPPRAREIFLTACAHFQVDPRVIEVVHAGAFAVSRDPQGAWRTFLDRLDEYALWLRDFWPPSRGHSVSDRVGTGIAAHLAGWKPQVDQAAFIRLVSVCRQLWIGDWRQPRS